MPEPKFTAETNWLAAVAVLAKLHDLHEEHKRG
jgi:hypothetical protein